VIAHGVTPPRWLSRQPEAPVIIPAEPAFLRELANLAADWVKKEKRAKQNEPALPPDWSIKTLLARPSWPFPPLEGVLCAPTLRPDGSLLDTPGYDAETGLYLEFNGMTYPPLPKRPTLDDARSAIGTLQQVFIDFRWRHPAYFSATIAALLTIADRYGVPGCTPLFAVRSTTPGSGKGLLIDAISVSATGRCAPRFPQVLDEDEERKRLFALALAGDTCGHIDNVTRPLGSPALDMALTSRTYSDRILGKHETQTAPWNVVLFASGNNMDFHGDAARRVVSIDLDPQMENPEERTAFAHNPLLPWVQEEHPKLLAAALTLLQAYFEAGCPAQGLTPVWQLSGMVRPHTFLSRLGR